MKHSVVKILKYLTVKFVEICCNPNKVDIDIYDGEVSSLTVSDGNE